MIKFKYIIPIDYLYIIDYHYNYNKKLINIMIIYNKILILSY